MEHGFRLEKSAKDDILLFGQIIMCSLRILNIKIGSQEDLEKIDFEKNYLIKSPETPIIALKLN